MGDWHSGLQFWLITTICAGAGAYCGAYLKKKGENLATKEDLNDLVTQMKAVTLATKTIESEITDRSWHKQRYWEFKRDALIAALEPLSRADDITIKLATAFAQTNNLQNPQSVQSYKSNAAAEWQQEMNLFDSKRRILQLVCTSETSKAFYDVSKQLRSAASKIFKAQVNGYVDVVRDIQHAIAKAFAAARAELNIQDEQG